MTNPLYVDDPDFYERPGETVHLITDVNPPKITVPALPWQEQDEPPKRQDHEVALGFVMPDAGINACTVCGRDTRAPAFELLCAYCARAQARDETARARARQPQPSTPRIQVREGWERWASEQPRQSEPEPTIREHETRIG